MIRLEPISEARDPRVREFMRWTKERVVRTDAALSADALAQRFADEHLFGDDDDHDFRLPFYC